MWADPIDDFDDAAADRWNNGALDACRHKAKASADPDYLKGYAEGVELRKALSFGRCAW